MNAKELAAILADRLMEDDLDVVEAYAEHFIANYYGDGFMLIVEALILDDYKTLADVYPQLRAAISADLPKFLEAESRRLLTLHDLNRPDYAEDAGR